jgi:phosphoglycerate dehydrogenase-like enzyme/predicted dehydrogenase
LPALAALREEGLVDLVGICDVNGVAAREMAAKFQVADVGAELADLVRRVDAQAVTIAIPPGPNVQLAIDALSLGLHLMTEKPPARTVGQARRMAEAASAHPELVTMTAFNRRHAPFYARAIQASKALGPPSAFHGRFTRASLGQGPSDTATDWITSDASHALDLAIATMGMPVRVSVARRRCGTGPDNVWTIQLHTASGSAVLVFDFAAGRRVERFEWSGPGYDVSLELPGRGEWAVRGRAVEVWTAQAAQNHNKSDNVFADYGFLDQYRAFVDAIRERRQPPNNFAYGVTFMRLVATILDMQSGESREFQAEVVEPPMPSAANEQGRVRLAPTRPAVWILQAAPARQRHFETSQLSSVAESCDLHLRVADEWRRDLAKTQAVVTGWGGLPLTREDLQRAEQLALVVVIGASVRSVEPAYLLDRGVLVYSTADAIARSVAEHCLMLTLAGLRRLTNVDKQMHAGGWPPLPTGRFNYQVIKRSALQFPGIDRLKPMLKPLGRRIEARNRTAGGTAAWQDIEGLVVGLIGWGHIARHFARMLVPLGCEILVYSESADANDLAIHGVRRASLAELLGSAKVISLHRGLTPRTQGTLGTRELDLLRPGTVFVNTARAQLVDEKALIARLSRGDIVAALDVFDQEPLPSRHPLRNLPNAILTPHNSSSTPQCQRRVGRQALDILSSWLAGSSARAIDEKQLASMT